MIHTLEEMQEMVDYLTQFPKVRYSTYTNTNGVKMIDVHVFMEWLADWADKGLSQQVEMCIKLLDTMSIANLMPGRLTFPAFIQEEGGMRYAALKVDLYKRLIASIENGNNATKQEEENASNFVQMLMDAIIDIGSY